MNQLDRRVITRPARGESREGQLEWIFWPVHRPKPAPTKPPRLSPEQAQQVQQHMDLAHRAALVVVRYAGGKLSFDELRSTGYEALCHASMNYDPASPASFATFALPRVRGAMIDELRRCTPAQRCLERRRERLDALLRLASYTPDEDRGGVERRIALARSGIHRSLALQPLSEPRPTANFEGFAGDRLDAEHRLLQAEERQRLESVIDELAPDHQFLIRALYLHEQTMKSVARALRVSIATICRRHRRLLSRLGELLEDSDESADVAACVTAAVER